MREIKRVVRQADRVRQLEKCTERVPLIAEVVCRGGCGMLRCTWGRGTQMGFRLSRGCWRITVEDPSHVLCAMGVPLIPTLLDIF